MREEIREQTAVVLEALRKLRSSMTYEMPGMLHATFAELNKLDQLEEEAKHKEPEWP